MTISLNRLQDIAERASKGEWVADDNIVFCDGESVALDCRHNDATFIAIANPATIIKLIRVARFAKVYLNPPFGCGVDAWDKLDEALKEIEE